MMEQKEVEDRIKHIKHNLDFWVLYGDDLLKKSFSKERMEKQVDKLLDELIELIKLRK